MKWAWLVSPSETVPTNAIALGDMETVANASAVRV